MRDYTPIPCELYARFELWAIRHRTIRVVWRDRGTTEQIRMESLLPIDLQTRDHVEYLIARRRSGEAMRLRLDCILQARPL